MAECKQHSLCVSEIESSRMRLQLYVSAIHADDSRWNTYTLAPLTVFYGTWFDRNVFIKLFICEFSIVCDLLCVFEFCCVLIAKKKRDSFFFPLASIFCRIFHREIVRLRFVKKINCVRLVFNFSSDSTQNHRIEIEQSGGDSDKKCSCSLLEKGNSQFLLLLGSRNE